jgi:hypothetical protein
MALQSIRMANLQTNNNPPTVHRQTNRHHIALNNHLQTNNRHMEEVNSQHMPLPSAESNTNQVTDPDTLLHNRNNTPLPLLPTNKAVLDMVRPRTLNLAIMLRCLVDCMAVEVKVKVVLLMCH